MSRASRKGDVREHEWANEWGGKKLSKKGYEGPDVKTPPLVLAEPMTIWEVKSKEDLPLWLVGESETRDKRGWIPQMEKDGSHGIAFRQNYKDWYFIARGSQLEAVRDNHVYVSPRSEVIEVMVNGVKYRAVDA